MNNQHWVIYSPNENSSNSDRGYWNSVDHCWTTLDEATDFPESLVGYLPLPASTGSDRSWLSLSLALVQDMDGLNLMLRHFCNTNGLPYHSADGILQTKEAANASPFVRLWLLQFCEQWEKAAESEPNARPGHFVIPSALKNRLRQALWARGHEEIGDQVFLQHPSTLGADMIVATGGGCEAYFVDVKVDGQNVLVVWTSDDGGDLATASDHRAGVYLGEEITEDSLAMIDSSTLPSAARSHETIEVENGVSVGVPDWLFDGYAIYSYLSEKAQLRTSPENVSDTLDAIKRLLDTQRNGGA